MRLCKKILLLLLFIFIMSQGIGCNSIAIVTPMTDGAGSVISAPEEIIPTNTVEPEVFKIWISPDLPKSFRQQLILSKQFINAESEIEQLELKAGCTQNVIAYQVLSLVAPFATITEVISTSELMNIWKGISDQHLAITEEGDRLLSDTWGSSQNELIKIVAENDLAQTIDARTWAIVPFEQLDPHWKVIKIGDISPLDREFKNVDYALSIPICVQGEHKAVEAFLAAKDNNTVHFPKSNRDETHLTSLLMTGTTALTRDIALKMDEKGVDYPAEKILPWFQSVDLVHVSNEVSFKENCDLRDRLLFCSKYEYLQLLKDINANIIELTGNHLIDFGAEPFLNTIDLYKQNGTGYYGGGKNLLDARKPLLIEHNSNKLAFLGCNAVGPQFDLATITDPGANPCDRSWLQEEISKLKAEGYQVIVTYQDMETYDPEPVPAQRGNFIFAAEAGATIVSGSQAHCPQAMEFWDGAFLHYGLGNLFFDQMDGYNRQEFLDRYTFYENRLISIELLTAQLEDYSQPRLMTDAERTLLLERIFNASGWR